MKPRRLRSLLLVTSLALALGQGLPAGSPSRAELLATLQRKPEDLRARWRLGNLNWRSGRYAEAARAWARVATRRPSAERWYRVGVARDRAGDRGAAEAAFRRVLELESGHPRARRRLEQRAAEAGLPEPTSDDQLEGLEVRPLPDEAEQAWRQASELRSQDDLAGAVAAYRRAFAAGYERAEVELWLGRTLLEDERLGPAILHLRSALDAVPGDQGIHLWMAKALRLAGRPGTSADHLRQAVRIDPGFAEAHYHLALYGAELGDSRVTLRHARRTLALDPEYRPRLAVAIKDSAIFRRALEALSEPGSRDRTDPMSLDAHAESLLEILYREELGAALGGGGREAHAEGVQAKGVEDQGFADDLEPGSGPGKGSPEPALDGRNERLLRPRRAVAAPGSAPPEIGGVQGTDPAASASLDDDDQETPTPGTRLSLAELRKVLQGFAEGRGRSAFEAIPSGRRTAFRRRFLDAIRSDPRFADLRGRVEAALRG